MKAEDIIQCITQDKIHQIVKEYMSCGSRRLDYCTNNEYFKAGAQWMLDNPTGGALLYAVEKTAERTKREMIEKAVEWLGNNMFHSVNNGIQINGIHIWDFLEKFKQAMENEISNGKKD